MENALHHSEAINKPAERNKVVQNGQDFFPYGALLEVRRPRGVYVEIVKPGLDFLFALLLLILSIPSCLLISILIKLESKGPVLFKQERYGKDGKLFWMYKFRTMYHHVPREGPSPESDQDPRITGVGRLLRKSSLDEIPQLFNILKGDMSFIGPRPEQTLIVKLVYTHYEKQRLQVKPGITGLWQVSLDRTKPVHENLHYDFKYIRNLSLWMDLKIIWKTLTVMVKNNTY